MTLVKCQYSRRSHCAINGGVPDTEVNIYIYCTMDMKMMSCLKLTYIMIRF